MEYLEPRSAEPSRSIWHEISESTFRANLVQLEERTNAVPIHPEVFSLPGTWQSDTATNAEKTATAKMKHALPLAVEAQLADDFAFLAAVEEGAQSVAAASVEELSDGRGLVIRFASMDAMKPKQRDALQRIAGALMEFAQNRRLLKNDRNSLSRLRGLTARLHRQRIVARLRSTKWWTKPRYLAESHKKPLWKDFSNLIHRAQFLYVKREQRSRIAIQLRLAKLASLFEGFENGENDSALEYGYILRIIDESYKLCTSEDMKAYMVKLEGVRATSQVASAIKCVRQIEKIAAYARIPISLLAAAEAYPLLFANIEFQYLTPYASIPTSISYEPWAKTCHVHAEVQLAVYYDLHPPELDQRKRTQPRVLGTSKYMCFLCLIFIRSHGSFFPANTHGRLYDQWTIPDLAEFDSFQAKRYRDIVQGINNTTLEMTPSDPKWRPEPMTSRQDLTHIPGARAAWIGTGRALKAFPYHESSGNEDNTEGQRRFVVEQLST